MHHRLHQLLLAVLVAASSVVAQNANVTVLKSFDPRGRLSGVWGYAAPDGREFALVGEWTGTQVVETTDPKNPVERGYFAAASSKWREITTYGHIAYSVSENHRGIRVIDLSNPAAPVDKGVVLSANITHTHSISVDPGAGRLYANGTNLGMIILDVSKDPTKPTILGTYTGSYVHDAYVRRGKAYLCDVYNGNLGIFDVTNPSSLKQIAVFQTPLRVTHNCWATDDDKLLVTTDEIGTGYLQVYDISTPTAPVAKGSYVGASGEICHNAHIAGRVCYMAYNSAGFHACDLSDPSKPVGFAQYDTSTTTSGYNGVWGCYPFQDSGVVYASDRDNGLFLLQLDCGHMNRYGAGSAPTGQWPPRARFDGAAPRVGAGKLELRIDRLQPNAAFAVALSSTSVPGFQVLGVRVHVDLTNAVWVIGRADSRGEVVLPAPVPNDARLGGGRVYLQMFAADARMPRGISASRGMWAGICK